MRDSHRPLLSEVAPLAWTFAGAKKSTGDCSPRVFIYKSEQSGGLPAIPRAYSNGLGPSQFLCNQCKLAFKSLEL